MKIQNNETTFKPYTQRNSNESNHFSHSANSTYVFPKIYIIFSAGTYTHCMVYRI